MATVGFKGLNFSVRRASRRT